SYADFFDWQSQSRSFSAMAGYEPVTFSYTRSGEPERVGGAVVTPDFFDVLAVHPWRGRALEAADATPGTSGVLVTHGFWQRHFGSNEAVVGQPIVLDGRPQPILGILPPDFVPPLRGWDSFMPVKINNDLRNNRGNHAVYAVGRLHPGVAME